MKLDILIGLQWGDEGKGKIVDYIASDYNVIARFQGGPNAGHTLEFESQKHVLHTIPSGVFNRNSVNVIGNGVVIDPVIFSKEVEELLKFVPGLTDVLYISNKAHLILPSHRLLDAASEKAKGNEKIGSTLKGIGPAYMDRTGRNGLRIGDILSPDFLEKYNKLVKKHKSLVELYNTEFDISEYEEEWMQSLEVLKKFRFIDSEYYINDALNSNKRVLAEGAQGSLLDIEFGTYPFVTSSNTIAAGACIGLGVPPSGVGDVFGICKAYCTRVGSGPFPTELFDDTGRALQLAGNEIGATTGRTRRCGWLDMVALKHAVMINGVTKLFITKIDVLNQFEKIKVATSYRINGVELKTMPHSVEDGVEPVYTELKGWNSDISGIDDYTKLPVELIEYIRFIESETNVPVTIISVGPDRTQTILR